MPAFRPRGALLWTLALLLMAGTALHQRRTGPTHPLRGRVEVAGRTVAYRLLRSAETPRGARVALPDPGVPGRLRFRRYPTDEAWTELPLRREGGELAAYLPAQPPAGKLEYRLELDGAAGPLPVPAGDTVVLRYKGPVAGPLLLAHVLCMFLGVLFGLRAGLSALAEPSRQVRHGAAALVLLAVGGLVLGPFVQKAAFGAYWTGWPFGGDLTDTKTLALVLVWAAALAALRLPAFGGGRARWILALASLAMLAVYLVPHSLRGSQLDPLRGQVVTGRPGR